MPPFCAEGERGWGSKGGFRTGLWALNPRFLFLIGFAGEGFDPFACWCVLPHVQAVFLIGWRRGILAQVFSPLSPLGL